MADQPAAFAVRAVSASEVRPLRQRVLRPNESLDALAWPHDEDADTLHAGAFSREEPARLIGVATLHRERPPAAHFADRADDGRAWRLRGMATDPALRGRGAGASLVAFCLDYARARGGSLVWCNARVTAARFYQRLGFRIHGAPFELPTIGPHVVMSIDPV